MKLFPDRDILPTVATRGWVNGWKAANLIIQRRTGDIGFVSMFQMYGESDPTGKVEPWGLLAEANCQFHRHKAPHKPCRFCKCECGFYAVDELSRDEVLDYFRKDVDHGWGMVTENLVILSVAFKGEMYQGQKTGFEARVSRAQYQQVTSMYVPRSCAGPDCFGVPTALGIYGRAPLGKRLKDYAYLRPVCPEHAPSGSFSLQRCSDRLGVPVAWHDPLTRVRV